MDKLLGWYAAFIKEMITQPEKKVVKINDRKYNKLMKCAIK